MRFWWGAVEMPLCSRQAFPAGELRRFSIVVVEEIPEYV